VIREEQEEQEEEEEQKKKQNKEEEENKRRRRRKRNSVPTFRGKGQESKKKEYLDSRRLRRGPIGSPETSARNNHCTLRNSPKERNPRAEMSFKSTVNQGNGNTSSNSWCNK
jgi:hypothetical protein